MSGNLKLQCENPECFVVGTLTSIQCCTCQRTYNYCPNCYLKSCYEMCDLCNQSQKGDIKNE